MNHNPRVAGVIVVIVLAMLGMSSFFAGFYHSREAGTFTYQSASAGGTNMAAGQPPQLVLGMNVTHDNSQNYTLIKLRLFNDRTNQDVHFVTYQLGIVKDANSSNRTAAADNGDIDHIKSPLLLDLFQTQGAVMTLKIIYDPTVAANTVIAASREPFQNAAQADPSGVITIRTPSIKPEGSYLLYAKVLTIDYPTNIITDKEAPEVVFSFDGRDKVKEMHLIPGCIIIENDARLSSTKGSGSADSGSTNSSNSSNNTATYTGNCKPTSSSLIPQPTKTKGDLERLKAADLSALEYARGYTVSHNVALSGENVYAVWQKDVAGIYPYIAVAKLFFAASHDEGRTFGRAINVTGDDIGSESPQIAAWKDNVYVLYTTAGIHIDRFGVGFVASHDGGKTFDSPLYLDNETEGAVATIRHSSYNASIYYESTQPVIAASGKNVYVAWLDNTNGVEHAIFTVSHDAGRTFEPTIALENKLTSVGYLRIALPSPEAQSSSTTKSTSSKSPQSAPDDSNIVHIVWTGRENKYGIGNTIALESSHDAGRSFGHTAYLDVSSEKDPSVEIQNLQVAAAANKHVYFIWQNPAVNDNRLMFTGSNEEGTDLQEPISLGTNQNNPSSQKILATGDDKDDGDDIYVLWQGFANTPTRTYGLLAASSHDGGETFEDAVKVGENAGDSWVIDPQILAVGKHVYVIWDESQQVFFGISKDGGETFQKPIVLSP